MNRGCHASITVGFQWTDGDPRLGPEELHGYRLSQDRGLEGSCNVATATARRTAATTALPTSAQPDRRRRWTGQQRRCPVDNDCGPEGDCVPDNDRVPDDDLVPAVGSAPEVGFEGRATGLETGRSRPVTKL